MKKIFALILCGALVLSLFSGCTTEEEPYVPTGDALVQGSEPENTKDHAQQQVLSQSGNAMLAQANERPQQILSLLQS